MKVNIIARDVIELYKDLNKTIKAKDDTGALVKLKKRFLLACMRTLESLDPVIKQLAELEPKKMIEFNKKRNDICILYAEKNEDGKPVSMVDESGQLAYKIAAENKDKFQLEMNLLIQKEMDEVNEEVSEWESEVLTQEMEIEIYKTSEEFIPEDVSFIVLKYLME